MKAKASRKGKAMHAFHKGHIKVVHKFFHSAMKKQISSVIALAFVVLTAGSVAVMTPFATAEMSAGQEYSYASPISQRSLSQVLGDSTQGQPIKLFSAANLKLQALPHDYDAASGKWNYEIQWNRMAGRSGSIYINGNVFVAEATSTGSNFTGYTLDPQTLYRVVFYSLANGKGVRVANRPFRTLAAPDITTSPDADVEDTIGASINATTTPPTMGHSGDHQSQGGVEHGKPLSTSTPSSAKNASSTQSSLHVQISIPKNAPVGVSIKAGAVSDPRRNVTFVFSWGDGSSDTASGSPYGIMTHTYSTVGQYTFSAMATDANGNTATKSETITIGAAGTSNGEHRQ
jgi:hypothetical protein